MFSQAVRIFTVRKIDIKVDPSWLLIATLITWSLAQHYFPQSFPGQTSGVYLVMAIFAMLSFFGSLLLHELAHSMVALRHGVPIKGITLFLFGGVAELGEEPKTATIELNIAIAGPLMSLALSVCFWGVGALMQMVSLSPHTIEVMFYLAMINLVLAIFNMVPAFPLDGGRILRAYLWKRHGNLLDATETAAKTGAVFAYTLMALGVLTLFQGGTVAGLWYVLIGAFILVAARSAYQTQLARKAFDAVRVKHLMTRNPVVASPVLTLDKLAHRIMLEHNVTFVPVVEDGVLLGHIDKALLAGIDRENWESTRVGDVFVGLPETPTVSPDTPVEAIMERISESGIRKFLVTNHHDLLGIITLSDLIAHLRQADMKRHAHHRPTSQ